jgi:hypothetical protein
MKLKFTVILSYGERSDGSTRNEVETFVAHVEATQQVAAITLARRQMADFNKWDRRGTEDDAHENFIPVLEVFHGHHDPL